jgi:hypothetical protein
MPVAYRLFDDSEARDLCHLWRPQPMEASMQVKLSPSQVQDSGKVRMGNMSPSFPAPRPDKAATTDSSKVRMGNMSPNLPAERT